MNHAAFLDAVVSEPDDLTHRLVFADWLEDNGEPDRAEFIRVQIHRETLHPTDPETRACLRREAELLAHHQDKWAAEIRSLTPRFRFQRGFIEEVTLDLDQLIAYGQSLFRLAPIRRLRLRRLIHLPELLRGNRKNAFILGLLLSRVRALDVSRDILSEPVGQHILDLPRLPEPEELNLEFNTLSTTAISILAGSPVLKRLQRLTFNSTVESAVAIATLLESPYLENLTHLCLANNVQGDTVVAILLGSRHLPRLRSLSLSHSNLSAAGLTQLIQHSAVASLRFLDLSFNNLGTEGMRQLAQSPHLGSLEHINLSRTRLDDAGVGVLTGAPLLGTLRGIDLSLNEIPTPAGVLLSSYEPPCRLGTLDLIYNSDLGEPARHLLEERFGEEVCLFER